MDFLLSGADVDGGGSEGGASSPDLKAVVVASAKKSGSALRWATEVVGVD